jgi:hypothetical protein
MTAIALSPSTDATEHTQFSIMRLCTRFSVDRNERGKVVIVTEVISLYLRAISKKLVILRLEENVAT